jgi:hypothetical protein
MAAGSALRPTGPAKSCIFINLVGGPAHLDTFDPKPDAPAEFRGPFRPIQSRVPGVYLSELLPHLARLADKFSLVRSMHHTAPPIHECGFQLLNTGRLFRDGPEWPSVGAVMQYLNERAGQPATFHVMPGPDVNTGVSISHGFSRAYLGKRSCTVGLESGTTLDSSRFGSSALGRSLATAVEAVRLGRSFVTVNMFDTVFDSPSWDCHADGGSLKTDLNDIRETVAPAFDFAVSRLIQELAGQGLLDSTLVVATGEFGRTPRMNANGGRDHWANAWTALVAGGGIQGGRVIGSTDAKGTEPADRPVMPQELVATIFHALGVPAGTTIPGPSGVPVEVYPGRPVTELF